VKNVKTRKRINKK